MGAEGPSGEQIYFEDRAVFRFENQVFFASEINIYLQALKQAECLGGNGLIFNSFKSRNAQALPSEIGTGLEDLQKNRNSIKQIVEIMKVQSVALEKKSVRVASELLSKLGSEKSKCAANFSTLAKESENYFLDLMETELYLRERFGVKKTNSAQSIDVFLSTVGRRINVEYLF